MTYWIAKVHNQQLWLPGSKLSNKTSAELCSDKPPRLFKSEVACKTAITFWKMGQLSNPDPEICVNWEVSKAMPERDHIDLRPTEMILTPVGHVRELALALMEL